MHTSQGPPHRSSHGRNGGLPGVTPPPPPQLPALSFSKRVYLVRFSNCLQSHFIEWVFYDDLPKCHMLLKMKMTKMVIILIECRMLAASLSIFSLVAAASTKNSTRQNWAQKCQQISPPKISTKSKWGPIFHQNMPQKWSQNIYVKNPTQRCVKTANKVKPKICGIISTKQGQEYFE